MGYTTDFSGGFTFSKPLSVIENNTLVSFNEERHNGKEFPGIWCQWVPDENGEKLVWDEGEKFYNYVEWLKYLIENFFIGRGIILNGVVEFFGEDRDDFGKIIVVDNVVTVKKGSLTFE